MGLFEALVNQAIGFGARVMFIKSDTKCGVVNDTGIPVTIQNCTISDARCIAAINPVLRSALKRTFVDLDNFNVLIIFDAQ